MTTAQEARLAMRRGEWAEARGLLVRSIEADPGHPHVHAYLGEACERLAAAHPAGSEERSRRVREAMRIFEPCYEAKTFRKHYRGVRRVTRTLGAVRNFDVCIDFFSKFRKRLEEPDAKEAAAHLLKQQKKEELTPFQP